MTLWPAESLLLRRLLQNKEPMAMPINAIAPTPAPMPTLVAVDS